MTRNRKTVPTICKYQKNLLGQGFWGICWDYFLICTLLYNPVSYRDKVPKLSITAVIARVFGIYTLWGQIW